MNWRGICFATGQEFQGPVLCLTLQLTTKFRRGGKVFFKMAGVKSDKV